MPRKYVSSGSALTLNVVPDWPLNVSAADLSGKATVVLPGAGGAQYNRPDKVHVVFYPGTPPAGATPEALLAAGPAGSAPAPAVGVVGNDTPVDITVPLPLPLGTVTVVAVGEFLS